MKKLLLLLVIFHTLSISAQGGFKFLGMDISGKVDTWETKLRQKGFSPTKGEAVLAQYYSGIFRGRSVTLAIPYLPSSNEVCAVMVSFDNIGEVESNKLFTELHNSLSQKYGKELNKKTTANPKRTVISWKKGNTYLRLNIVRKGVSLIYEGNNYSDFQLEQLDFLNKKNE